MKKDKQKVIGEDLNDERIKELLDRESYDDTPADFVVLLNGYRQLRPFDFKRLVDFLVAAGRDVNAKSLEGETLLAIVSGHKQGEEYADVLKQAGAQ